MHGVLHGVLGIVRAMQDAACRRNLHALAITLHAQPHATFHAHQTKDNVFTTLVVSIQYQVVPESLYEVRGLLSERVYGSQ